VDVPEILSATYVCIGTIELWYIKFLRLQNAAGRD